MKVAIDVRPVTSSPAGIGQYTRCLVHALTRIEDPPELQLFGNRETAADLLPSAPGARLFRLPGGLMWHEVARTSFRRSGASVYHSPSSALVPMALRERAVITVHDLVPLIFPETSSLRTRLGYRVLRRAARLTGAVIAVSQNTRSDLERVWGLDRRIDVVYEAARSLPAPGAVEELAKLDVEPPYFLAVGTLEPRKNLKTLIRAYATATSRNASLPRLVIVGASGWGGAPREVAEAIASIADRVHPIGYRTDEELATLYAHATAFALPSLYEGFGLPALEAMAAGTPVVAASSGSLPEVLADAAAYFEPEDASTLADVLEKVAEDSTYRAALSARGRERASQFSWTQAARETFAIYQNVAKTAS